MTTSYMTILQKIDPTEGLITYVQSVKPYRSKILDVSIDYIYTDVVNGTITEEFQIDQEYQLTPIPTLMNCGYGNVWDTSQFYQTNTSNAIISATGPQIDVVATTSISTNLSVLTTRGFSPTTGQLVTAIAIDVFPPSTPQIVPGLVYSITVVGPDQIQLTEQRSGLTVDFSAAQVNQQFNISLQRVSTNFFTVRASQWSPITCFALDTFSNLFAFGIPYTVQSSDNTANAWSVAGDLTSIISPGMEIFINTSIEPTFCKSYTVISTSYTGATQIVVQEPVFSVPSGAVMWVKTATTALPWWLPGTAVTIQTSGSLPTPLTNQTYYFIPSSTVGEFNLATVRYPTTLTEFVSLSTVGTGTITVTRQDTYLPGNTVRVSGSAYGINNGLYTVQSVEQQSATTLLVYTIEPVAQTTPPGSVTDGIMELATFGYSYERYCIPVQSGLLDLNGYITESLVLNFDLLPQNFMSGVIVEIPAPPIQQTADAYPQIQLLPTGIDGQLFDVGGLVEDVGTLPKSYGSRVAF